MRGLKRWDEGRWTGVVDCVVLVRISCASFPLPHLLHLMVSHLFLFGSRALLDKQKGGLDNP